MAARPTYACAWRVLGQNVPERLRPNFHRNVKMCLVAINLYSARISPCADYISNLNTWSHVAA